MLFHMINQALREGCTVNMRCNGTIRQVWMTRPLCNNDKVIAHGHGRTIEEALALAQENYETFLAGIPDFRTQIPSVGNLQASGPLDRWVLDGNMVWVAQSPRDAVELHLHHKSGKTTPRSFSDQSFSQVITTAFKEFQPYSEFAR